MSAAREDISLPHCPPPARGPSWGSALGGCGDPGGVGRCPRLSRCFPCTHGNCWEGKHAERPDPAQSQQEAQGPDAWKGPGEVGILRGLRRARVNARDAQEMPDARCSHTP